jgi:Indolepyruvate ferredoxin oxidoreductase, alpha and beta subunits
MVTVDLKSCTGCGVCLRRFEGYCISSRDGKPCIDYSLCNQCQKCVAICPNQAFLMNNVKPLKMEDTVPVSPESLEKLLARRRSVKKFQNKQVPDDILRKIAQMAKYAPNQNKNIDIVIVNDPEILTLADAQAIRFVRGLYRWLFSGPIGRLIRLNQSARTIRKKMEYDLFQNRHIVKENTNALFLATGNSGVPVTEESAQYLLGTMTIYAYALGVGTCLMDSLKMSINRSRHIKKEIGIPQNSKVLGVLAAGYSNENFINIPQGYAINIYWNRMNK